jgi:hypothetical protein
MRVVPTILDAYRNAVWLRDRYVAFHRHWAVRTLLLPALPIYGFALGILWLDVKVYERAMQIMEAGYDSLVDASTFDKLLNRLAFFTIRLADEMNYLYVDEHFCCSLRKFRRFMSIFWIAFMTFFELIFTLLFYFIISQIFACH